MAFLDLYPIRPGHTLIIPKEHFDYFDDVPAELITPIMLLGQKLAVAMKALYGVARVSFLYTGGDSTHAHAHVVPIHDYHDVTSRRYIVEKSVTFQCTPEMPDVELAAEAARLIRALSAQN
jgi:histidine triad (HIT) family protein